MLTLVGANLNYSSWTMRAWLALRHAGVDFRFHDVGLKTSNNWKERILSFCGAGTVPILVEGPLSIHESLAICEYVAELYPSAQLWPADLQLRARARAVSTEMATSFVALREAMPTNLRGRSQSTPGGPAIFHDVARVIDIWESSLAARPVGGPFLFGAFGIADCMFFPVATRFRTYGVHLPSASASYVAALFENEYVRELLTLAEQQPVIEQYEVFLR